MDRFKLNTKALLGMATRTVDQDHEVRHTCVKTLFQTVNQYETAMVRLVESVSALSNSFEGAGKAYIDVVANEKHVFVFDGVREITTHLKEIGLTIIPEFLESFTSMVSTSLSALKDDCQACERVHADRVKAVDVYDYHRDVVEKKEVQYAAKGKLLDVSKHYKDDLNKLDVAKKEYMAKHAEYNKTYDELMRRKSELTTISAKVFSNCLLDLIEKLQNSFFKMVKISEEISKKLRVAEMMEGEKEEGGERGGAVQETQCSNSGAVKDTCAVVADEQVAEQS